MTAEQSAIDFANRLAGQAGTYAAFSNPSHPTWKPYGVGAIEAVVALDLLKAVQIRPLLIAMLDKFSVPEAQTALPMLAAWTVRFLIKGAGGSGTLENRYAERAKDISDGAIKTAADLWRAMEAVVPSDPAFKDAFAEATVSQQYLARFYLRSLENQAMKSTSELVVSESVDDVTLEHILPQNPGSGWSHIPQEEQKAVLKRIGNLALLDKALNNEDAGSADFATKKKVYHRSRLLLTKELAKKAQWTPTEIAKRQQRLADLAIKAWPAGPTT